MSLLSPPLEAFWAVACKRTVQDASKILGLTQTGVTQRIRSLERQLKTTLFIRSRTGMKLTAEGEALLHFVKSSIELEGMALSKIQRAANDSIIEVSISGPPSILRSRVIPHLNLLLQHYPKMRFHFNLNDHENNSEKLKTSNCDFAILEQHQVAKEMASKNLKMERYSLYGPARWKHRPLADILKNEVLIELSTKTHLTAQFLEKNKLKSKIHNDRHSINSPEALTAMISAGIGYSILSQEYVESFVKKNQLIQLGSNYFLDLKMALAWYPRHEMAPYFKAVIQTIH